MKKLVFFSYVFLSTSIFIQAAVNYQQGDFTFLVSSDIHQTDGASKKDAQKELLLQDISDHALNTSAVILTGDLTDNGSEAEFHAFMERWIIPITGLMPTKFHNGLYLCKGNHDEAAGSKSQILEYLKQTYGGFCYSFDIDGLHFACCGKYPQKTILGGELKWLKSDLAKLAPGTPIVIFFHYNILGEYSSWWSVSCGSCICTSAKNEKDYFFNAIKDYNIQAIFFGHLHFSYSALWRDRFRIAGVGGDKYAICQYEQATQTVYINFKDNAGKIHEWNDPAVLRNDLEEL